MGDERRLGVSPAADDDEAAAIMAAIEHLLAAGRRDATVPGGPERRWAQAGRLASQGLPLQHPPGMTLGWATAARLARTRR